MRRKDDKEARKVQETDLQEQLGTKSHWKVAAVTGASNSKKYFFRLRNDFDDSK